MYHIFFIRSSADGHVGCFHILAIVNSATVNTGMHASFQILVFSRYVPNSGIAGSYGSSVFGFFLNLFIYFCCVGSSFLCKGFLQLRRAGATLHRNARASHHRGPSCCGAQAPDAQAQQSWLTGPAAPRHVGSSQTRARTRVPCTGRQILNHCATREAPVFGF